MDMNSDIITQQLDEIDSWLKKTPNLFNKPEYCTKKCEIKRRDKFNREVVVIGRSKYINDPGDDEMLQTIKAWKDEEDTIAYGYIKGNNGWTFYLDKDHLSRESFEELFSAVKKEIKDINFRIDCQLENQSDKLRLMHGKEEKYR